MIYIQKTKIKENMLSFDLVVYITDYMYSKQWTTTNVSANDITFA